MPHAHKSSVRFFFFLLAPLAVAAADDQPTLKNIDLNAMRGFVGSSARVFEIKSGEANVGLPFLQRIQVGRDIAMLIVRNEGTAPLGPNINVRFYNTYGMELAQGLVSFEADPVLPGGFGAKQIELAIAPVDRILAASAISLAPDWKTLRYVTVHSDGNPALTAGTSTRRLRQPFVQEQKARPAILERHVGSTNIGNVAVDAKWGSYGAYLQRFIDTVQIQWERIMLERGNPAVGSVVTVKLIMNDEGKITRIVKVDSTANDSASRACVSAITDRAPYGPWTDDMRTALGKQQEITFSFFYQ